MGSISKSIVEIAKERAVLTPFVVLSGVAWRSRYSAPARSTCGRRRGRSGRFKGQEDGGIDVKMFQREA
jgi:hypothetical protein